jgi:hypothetical protein
LKSGVDAELRKAYGVSRNNWPVSISRSFLPTNTTAPADLENFATRFRSTDIFLVCYLVSELKGSISAFEKVINSLVVRASSDALILFIDRDEREVRDSIQRIIERNSQLASIGLKKERGGMEDNLEDFGEWYINLPTLPRRKWMAFFALAQKAMSS